MLSKRLLFATEWRLYLIELTFFSPIAWDWKTHTLKPSMNFAYWNWMLQQFYLFAYMMVLIIQLFFKFGSNSENDIPDDAGSIDTKKDDAYNALLTAVDIAYVAAIAIILGLAINLIRARQDLICLFNKIIEVDTTLTEKYQEELQGNPTVKEFSLRAELTLGATYVITLIVVPAMFIIFFMQDMEPLHRFLAEVLEIDVELKLEHLHFFVGLIFSIAICGNTVCIYTLCTNGNIHVVCFWLVNTTPREDSPIEYIKEEGKESSSNPVLVTRLGLMDGKVIVDIYKRLQFLDRLVDNLLASFLVTLHHGGCMIVFVSTCYMCIEYIDVVISRQGLEALVLVPFVVVLVEWVETIELCRIHDTSRDSVKILKNRFRTSFVGTRKRKSKELWKMAEAFPVLWMETAYPFYRYSQGTFLEFFHKAIDLLVSALVLEIHITLIEAFPHAIPSWNDVYYRIGNCEFLEAGKPYMLISDNNSVPCFVRLSPASHFHLPPGHFLTTSPLATTISPQAITNSPLATVTSPVATSSSATATSPLATSHMSSFWTLVLEILPRKGGGQEVARGEVVVPEGDMEVAEEEVATGEVAVASGELGMARWLGGKWSRSG
ncbi:unnamed protein product [Orchesella dallaii]|uniref:Gustatory receptor n=1 Tax=Orchesella dallaii TaxID=48710 RepID=A0ABP1QQ20_9HEXA